MAFPDFRVSKCFMRSSFSIERGVSNLTFYVLLQEVGPSGGNMRLGAR